MSTHVSETQVREWLDDTAISNVTRHADEEAAFNFQVELSRLPIHVIKETEFGPIRIVGRSGFDTDAAKTLLRHDRRRGELLEYVGPMLAATPGFYTFLDEDEASCELREAEAIQVEYRIYPDGASQQALMDTESCRSQRACGTSRTSSRRYRLEIRFPTSDAPSNRWRRGA